MSGLLVSNPRSIYCALYLAEAHFGQRVVFFMEAAPLVFAPFLGRVWCFERLFVKAPSGRNGAMCSQR